MDTPQEVEVWLILPAIRKQLVLNLKQFGYRQKQIAKMLNVSEAAVSQYLKNKRGKDLFFSETLLDKFKVSAKKIAEQQSNVKAEIQRLLKVIHSTRYICEVCHDHTESELGCDICFQR